MESGFMNRNIDYNEFLLNQEELRGRLMKVIITNAFSLRKTSTEIGIAFNTLSSFLKRNKNVDLVPLSKILNFVEQYNT